ncbi:MAG: ABC transporter substrate-binding protein [Afipia sp.]|jgi:NitT/TauT family transport system substrate-binding protein|nr:ABC transporter substrate-binding protein [Afipia sp.]
MTMRAWIGVAAIAATLTGMMAFGARADEKDVIEFNYGIPTGAYAQLYVAEDQGLFAKHGLKPKFFSFQSGAPLLAGLKSGSLDVITTGLASVFALGQGIPVKYLFYMGDASQAEALIARRDSGIKTVKDLVKAKQVGAAVGTCAQISLYWAAKAAGTDYNSLKTVNIAPPLYRNAFLGGSLDAGVAWGPYSLQLASVGEHLVGYDAEWVPGGGTCPETTLIANAAMKDKPKLAERLVKVQAEALELIAKNPQLAVDALAKRLGIPPDIAKLTFERYFKDAPTMEKHLDPKSRYALVGDGGLFAQLKLASETYVALGVLKEPISDATLRDAIDPQFVKAYLEKR